MKCEKCDKDHDGKFGSGRFCSKSCSNSRERTTEFREKVSTKLKIIRQPIECINCRISFKPKKKFQAYCSRLCAQKINIKKAHESQKENPPNWSEINRKSYANGNNYVAGGTTKWLNYKNIKVQGSYELRMCYILDEMLLRKDIKSWEYTKDKYPYVDTDGTVRTYLLDFKVNLNDDTFYYIETKGYQKDNDLLKWKAVKQLNINLVIAFDKDIRLLEERYNLIGVVV